MQRAFSPSSTSTERSLPINNVLLKVPAHVRYKELWNHTSLEHPFCLRAFWEKLPKVVVKGSVFAVGLDQLKELRQTRDSSSIAVEVGLNYDLDETGEWILELSTPIHQESIIKWKKETWSKFAFNIMFANQSEADLNYSFRSHNFENFASRTQLKEKVLSLSHVLTACGICHVTTHRLDFSFSVAILATSFILNEIHKVDIVPSALAEALACTDDNFFYQIPQTGFVVMNEELQIMLLLDCDPIVNTNADNISLVGVWVSGVGDVTDLYVWACCARYFHHFHVKHEGRAKDPFMVIIFDNRLQIPLFFDCRVENCEQSSNMTEFNVHQTFHSANLQESLLNRKFDLRFSKTISRQTFEKCLKISCFSPKIKRRTPQTSRELSPIFCEIPNFNEPKTSKVNTVGRCSGGEIERRSHSIQTSRELSPILCEIPNLSETKTCKVNTSGRCSGGEIERCSHSMQLISLIKNKDEIIQDLRSQLDSLRNQTSNGSYHNNTNKISTSTMTDDTMYFPPLSTIITSHDYDSRGIEEISFGDYQQKLFADESVSQTTCGPNFKAEDVFGDDVSELNCQFENSYAQGHLKPHCKAINRKTITKPQRHVRPRDYSEIDDLSRFNNQPSVQESCFGSIVQPSSQFKKFEFSRQFREFANKYPPNNQHHNYDESELNYSIIAQDFRNRKK